MSLLFFEGFETVGTSIGLANEATSRPRIALRWDNTTFSGNPSVSGYFLIDDKDSEGYAIQMGSDSVSVNNSLRYDIPAAFQTAAGAGAPTFVVGCLVHIPNASRTFNLIEMRALDGLSFPFLNFWITVNTSSTLSAVSFPSSVKGTTGSVLNLNGWHYIEVEFKIGNSPDGACTIYVDGTAQLTLTSIDTNYFTSIGAIDIQFNSCSSADTGTVYVAYDNIYILTKDSTFPNTLLGSNVTIVPMPPNGDVTTDWTPSTGTTHYTLIDENGADAADYIETSTNTDEDMFDLTNMLAGAEIFGVKIEAEAIDTVAGANNLDVRVKSSSSVGETNHNVTSTSAYEVFTHYAPVDPNTSAQWTQTNLDAAEGGVQFNT